MMRPETADDVDASTAGASGVTIRAITADQRDMKGCYSVRRKVFIEEQKVPADIEVDGNDETATHILVTAGDDNMPVGAARIVYVDDGKVGKIGRVCVLSEHRGKGIGRQIVLFAVNQIRKEVGVNCGGKAKLGSQVHALEFYKSMGFELTGREEYMDGGGIPHRDMIMHF
jgi:predicted GNAT family N-acyltransferase